MQVYGDGTQSCDFSYVDDIAEGTLKALKLLDLRDNKFNLINLEMNGKANKGIWKICEDRFGGPLG